MSVRAVAFRMIATVTAVALLVAGIASTQQTGTSTAATTETTVQLNNLPANAQVLLVANDKKQEVRPIVRAKWWGYEIRLTKLQTEIVAHGYAAIVVVIPGIGVVVSAALVFAIETIASTAQDKGKCGGINYVGTWPVGVIVPVFYDC